jgi:CRISPR/Cas system-associated protein endoribonuclease Cas2
LGIKLILTSKYDDLILKNTSNWRTTKDIVRKVGGDKSAIIQACKRLVETDHLETNPNKNKVMYRRKNTAQSEYNFIIMMDSFEVNQKTELNALNQFSTLLMKDGKRLRQKSIDVLEHINEEVNRAYMVKVRLNYQKNLSLIPDHVAEERIKKIDKYIEKIRSAVMSKNKDSQTVKVIQDYFQNHTTKFEFKI